jgi:WD40 repeat protein/tRNA A-37 threonylcarbamoyl transferase component Bud32
MNGPAACGHDQLDQDSLGATSSTLTDEQEQRLRSLLWGFFERFWSGDEPDRDGLILGNPDIAVELQRSLDAALALHRVGRALATAKTCLTPGEAGVPARGAPTEPPANGEAEACAAPTSDPTSSRLGRYELRSVLGRGASCTVYRALDTTSRREVALKVFRFEPFDSPDGLRRFERDARIAAKLRHRNIVPLHGTDEWEGEHYIDMELIRGETLAARLARMQDQPLRCRRAAELASKVAPALDYAHSEGIIHRDVRPSNILIDERGEPVLTDFGLARHVAGRTMLALHGQVLGTPAYMSPEQADGRSHEADARSDVYSLGVVLYRMLTGKLPFDGAPTLTALLTQIVNHEPLHSRSRNPAIPRDLAMIGMKALEKRPADRFQTAGAFAEEFRRWSNGELLTIRPPSPWEKLGRWALRHRLIARVGAVSLLLLTIISLSLGATAWKQMNRAHDARLREAIEIRHRAADQVRVLIEQAPLRLRTPTQGRRCETQTILRGAAKPLALLPSSTEKEELLLEVRSTFAASLALADLSSGPGDRVELEPVFYQAWPVALHPDGESMVIGTPRGPLRWRRGLTLTLPPDLDPAPPRPRLTFSPDGHFLAVAPAGGGLELWNGAASQTVAEWRPADAGTVLSIGFRAGTLCAACSGGLVQSLALTDLRPGTRWSISDQAHSLTAAAFNLDVTQVVTGDEAGNVRLHELSGRLIREWSGGAIGISALSWSPDARIVAVGTIDGVVGLFDAAESKPLHRWPAFPLEVSSLLFDPDGRWVLAGARDEPMKMWDVVTGRQVLTVSHPAGALSTNGRTMAMGGTTVVAFADLVVPDAVRILHGNQSAVERLAWARNNRHLVTLDNRFAGHLWHVERGKSIDAFDLPRGTYYPTNAAVALSDDGRQLAYASGGGRTSHALIRDNVTRATVAQWELPAGYERLAYADGRFLLVREEIDASRPGKSGTTHTVMRVLAMGKTPEVVRTVRAAESSEDTGSLTSSLTSDAHLYLWVGPSEPPQNRRVEVRAVGTGGLVRRIAAPADSPFPELAATMDAEGRGFTVECATPERAYVDLIDADRPPVRTCETILATSSDNFWVAAVEAQDPVGILRRLRRCEDRARLHFTNDNLSPPKGVRFSPDGQFLAWGSEDGAIMIADLPALERDIRQLEQGLSPK